ncbi:chemotaxis protein CheW, partial [Oleiphilus sp. HI0066]
EPEPEPEPPQVRVRENSFKNLPEFEALLFDVKGLQLAVPLVSLGSIHRIDSDITPIVGRSSWYLGMLNSNAGNLQVVDTARWVMPSRMQASGIEDYEFVIRLGDTNWALACTSVSHAVRLQQSQVKWRTCNSKRPWLAGTVIDKMCALLDVDSFADLLDENKLHVSE